MLIYPIDHLGTKNKFMLLFLFKAKSHIAEAVPKLPVCLPLPWQSWDYKCPLNNNMGIILFIITNNSYWCNIQKQLFDVLCSNKNNFHFPDFQCEKTTMFLSATCVYAWNFLCFPVLYCVIYFILSLSASAISISFKPRAPCILGKYSATELYPQPVLEFYNSF